MMASPTICPMDGGSSEEIEKWSVETFTMLLMLISAECEGVVFIIGAPPEHRRLSFLF
jgi:hypothetical protein